MVIEHRFAQAMAKTVMSCLPHRSPHSIFSGLPEILKENCLCGKSETRNGNRDNLKELWKPTDKRTTKAKKSKAHHTVMTLLTEVFAICTTSPQLEVPSDSCANHLHPPQLYHTVKKCEPLHQDDFNRSCSLLPRLWPKSFVDNMNKTLLFPILWRFQHLAKISQFSDPEAGLWTV